MAKRTGLGKGLGALIPETVEGEADGTTQLREVPIDAVVPNPYQPREEFDEEGLASLSDSIDAVGVLQPILVRPRGDQFELIAGERRWRAAQRAGLTAIPAVVREIEDVTSLEQAVVENLHRRDLNALEEASAYAQLIEDFQLTQGSRCHPGRQEPVGGGQHPASVEPPARHPGAPDRWSAGRGSWTSAVGAR